MRLGRHRTTAVLLLGLQSLACTHWVPTGVAPRTLIEEDTPSSVLVVRGDGTELEVPEPVIRADSIASAAPCERVFLPDGRTDCRDARPAVALSDVRAVEVERTDLVRTMGAIALAPVIFVGAVFLTCGVSGDCFSYD